MPVCVPIRDMKDTARFSELVERAEGPVTVTKNGYEAFVVMRPEEYDALCDAAASAHLMERIAAAENDYASGRVTKGSEWIDELAASYGL